MSSVLFVGNTEEKRNIRPYRLFYALGNLRRRDHLVRIAPNDEVISEDGRNQIGRLADLEIPLASLKPAMIRSRLNFTAGPGDPG